MTTVEITEEDFSKILKEKGFSDWDVRVALEGFRRGAKLDLGGKVSYVIKEEE